jgi:hypothetical protein
MAIDFSDDGASARDSHSRRLWDLRWPARATVEHFQEKPAARLVRGNQVPVRKCGSAKMLERFLFPANAGALERVNRRMAEFHLALAGCPMPTIGAGLMGVRYSLRPAGVQDAANREGSGGGRASMRRSLCRKRD